MKYRTFRNLVTLGGIVLLLGFCGLCGSCGYFFSKNSNQNRNQSPSVRSTPTPSPVSTPAPSNNGLRRVDQMIVDLLNKQASATGDKIKDAFPRESFKVNVYRDGSSSTWTRLKVDLDRDEKDDEKWTLANGQPDKRQVSTNDDGRYDREYRWRGGQWVEKN
ncbi:MAG: hypothetical protein WCF57_07005 [Pyrinomonadaceae bacterium]